MGTGKKNTLGKNIAYMMFYHVFAALAPLIITPYVSRVLGATEIGKYTYAYSIAYYFVMVANLGISTHGSRRIAEVKHDPEKLNQTFSNLFWLHIGFSGLITAAYVAAVTLGLNRENSALSYIMIFYVLSSVVDVKWLFHGLENFRATVLRNVIIKIINIVLIYSFVKTQSDVEIYAVIMAFVGFFLCEASLFVLIFRKVRIRKPDSGMFREFLPLLLLFIPSVANLLLRHFDKIMIGAMSTYEQLGLYENTDRVLVLLSMLTTAIGDVMLPRISSLIATDNDRHADRLFTVIMRISIVMSCALTFGLMAVAREFVPVFFGSGFEGCVELMTWIAPSLIMLNISVMIRKQVLIPRHLEKVYIIATGTSLVINIIANTCFIPVYGALGAVYGTLIAEFSVLLIQFIMVHKQLSYGVFARDVLVFSVIGLAMYFAVRFVATLPLGGVLQLFLEIFTGAVVYIAGTFVVMKVTGDELHHYAETMLKKRRKKSPDHPIDP